MFRFMMVYLTLKRDFLSVLQDFPLILKTQNTRMALLIMYQENKKYLLELYESLFIFRYRPSMNQTIFKSGIVVKT